MTSPLVFPELIDSSMITAFRRCPQYFMRAYGQGLVGEAINIDLHAGGAFAAGLERARKAFFVEEMSAQQAVIAGIKALTIFWGPYDPPDEATKQWSRVVEAFLGYFAKWPFGFDNLRPIHSDRIPSIEYSFAIPLPILHPTSSSPLLYGGRLDMLGEVGSDYYVVDEKTTGRHFGDDWGKEFGMRHQFIGYVWAVQQEGIPVTKALIRGIYIGRAPQKDPAGGLDYTQLIVPIDAWQIERWHFQLLRTIERMIASFNGGFWDYDYGDGCRAYNRPCIFLPLCTAVQPEPFESLYTVRRWNPLHKDPSDTRLLLDKQPAIVSDEISGDLLDLTDIAAVKAKVLA